MTFKPSAFASVMVLLLTISTLAFKPLYENFVVGQYQQTNQKNNLVVFLNANANEDYFVSFNPSFEKADRKYQTELFQNNIPLEVYLAEFDADNKESELINWGNKIYDIDKLSIISKQNIKLKAVNGDINATLLRLVRLNGIKQNLIYWYELSDVRTSDKLAVKKAQLLNKLSGGSGGGSVVILSISEQQLSADKIKQFSESLPWL